jgi:GPI mannosyltransferase 1 subunit M
MDSPSPTPARPWLTFRRALYAGVILRIVLLIYGEYHDRHSTLKYTDVDYRVFSDATRFVLNANPDNQASGPFTEWLGLKLGK